MVNKNRIIPGIAVVFYIIFFFYFNYDEIFIYTLFFFLIYDFTFSKILSIKLLIFISSIFLIVFTFLTYNFHLIQLPLNIIFLISFISFFLFRKYQKFLFFLLNIINLILIYEILHLNKELFFLTVLLSFVNDTSAFISGKKLKGPLIAPSISPNKTWSGTIFSFLISFSLLIYFHFNFLFSLIISISFFLGDLFFSYFKRLNFIKDFSNILRGHGGFLDRFDSLFFVIPLLNIYVNYFK